MTNETSPFSQTQPPSFVKNPSQIAAETVVCAVAKQEHSMTLAPDQLSACQPEVTDDLVGTKLTAYISGSCAAGDYITLLDPSRSQPCLHIDIDITF